MRSINLPIAALARFRRCLQIRPQVVPRVGFDEGLVHVGAEVCHQMGVVHVTKLLKLGHPVEDPVVRHPSEGCLAGVAILRAATSILDFD